MAVPKYLQIAEVYQRLIDDGEICRDEKIPAVTDIANKHYVASATAQKVVDHLRREGYVRTSNQGTFVIKGQRRSKPRPALREDLSLAEGLVEFLDQCGWDGAATIQDVLDEHAHKLAEKQRRRAGQLAMLRSEDARLKAEGMRMGAVLIDPEKET